MGDGVIQHTVYKYMLAGKHVEKRFPVVFQSGKSGSRYGFYDLHDDASVRRQETMWPS